MFCPKAHPARVRTGMTKRAICVELPTAMPMASSILFLTATVTMCGWVGMKGGSEWGKEGMWEGR